MLWKSRTTSLSFQLILAVTVCACLYLALAAMMCSGAARGPKGAPIHASTVAAMTPVHPYGSGRATRAELRRHSHRRWESERRHAAQVRAAHEVRDEPWLPSPEATYESPYTPPKGDPILRLPRQVQILAACVRWREGGDLADQPNRAGMYQFTNEALWLEMGGARFAYWPSDATAAQQDAVFVTTWANEQFLPWTGDPCLGSLSWIVHDGRAFGWY